MMTDLSALIERVESGAGYDNELNKNVALALGWTIETGLPQGLRWRKPDGTLTAGNPEYEDAINATGSLDAVLSLIEAKLPGCGHCYATGWDAEGNCGGFISPERTVDLTTATMGQAPSPARALLSAALRAIQESRT